MLLSLVLLSLGTAFASDDDNAEIISVEDEMAVDEEVLAVEEDTQVLSDENSASSIVITNSNIKDYVDESGMLSKNITADEIIFEGTFEDLNLTVESPYKITGYNASLINPDIEIYSSDVTFAGFKINQTKGINSIFVGGIVDEGANISDIPSNVALSDLTIDYTDNMASSFGPEAIAIHVVNADKFSLANSVINYIGNTNTYYPNNAVLISKSNGTIINGNKFKLSLVSAAVGWAEVPTGSGNWVSSPMSEGIVIDSSDDVIFDSNEVNVDYNNVSGSYDTIYSVDFKNSNNAIVTNNVINSNGFTYIYGIIISGDNFIIRANNITSTGDYYANGIDIEGPATGVVEDNVIDVKANSSAYAIYSGMNGANVSANYTNNTIKGDAYNIFGFSLGDVESNLAENQIDLTGNYTTGIAYRGSDITIDNNRMVLIASEIGNESIWEGFGVEAVGVKVIHGNANITNNVIATSGIGISLTTNKTNAVLESNFINVVANDDKDAYAIYAVDTPNLCIFNNTIDYQGTTKGNGINNAVYLFNATDALIGSNKFQLELVSSYVPWFEIPTGSGNWVSYPVSEGIVIADSDGVIFDSNEVNTVLGDVVGSYDTIYAVDFKYSNDAVIGNNVINATGETYIYGIIISGEDFVIRSNNITSTGNYYANGIDIEGPASGVVDLNVINVKANTSAYGIYSGMNGANVSANYTNNTITGDAYNVFGFSLGDVESNLEENEIDLTGNYTTGIAYRGSDLTIDNNHIVLISSQEGNESIWEGFGVESVGVKVIQGNVTIINSTIATSGKGISLTGGKTAADIENNFINVVGNVDKDAYAIFAEDTSYLVIDLNHIDYQGTTNGSAINNAVYLKNATEAIISENRFDLDIVSAYVAWHEIPAGSGKWVRDPISEGIVIVESDDVIFDGNNVTVVVGDVVGTYDTVYSLDIIDSNNATVTNNIINSTGNTYIYGIIITGDDFIIRSNKIFTLSDYYANGIDIEGPASGVVEDNTIHVQANTSAYAIYSGMNGAPVKANYTDNLIAGRAYNVFGFAIADEESTILHNFLYLDGNYTTGIASIAPKLTVDTNKILAKGSNVGNLSIWESFGVQTIGINIAFGNATVIKNDVTSTGEFAVKVEDTPSSVHDNYLISDKLQGDDAVDSTGNAEIYNNTPTLKSVLAVFDINMQVGDGTQYVAILKDENNNAIANKTIFVQIGDVISQNVTDEKGIAIFGLNLTVGNYTAIASFDGEDDYAPVESTSAIVVSDIVPTRIDTVITVDAKFSRVATDYNAGERGALFYAVLTDINGNPLANKTVQIAVNGPIYNVTTDEQGRAGLQVNLAAANTYTYALSFQGDDQYNAAPLASSKLTVTKKSTSITAANKAFKAKTKTKTISVTLKTVKNPYDKKTYLKAGKKLTLKINGKTYTAKTNSKGVATFKITKLTKKGKYAAVIKFAGDKTYKASSKKILVTIK